MAELFLELYSEELPPSHQRWGEEALVAALRAALRSLGLEETGALRFRTAATPRRLAIAIDGLPLRSPDRLETIHGPRLGAPAAATAGFARKHGRDPEDLEIEETPKGRRHALRLRHEGGALAERLQEALPSVLRSLPWPKSMRWDESGWLWGRPLRGVLCCFDGEVLPFALAGLTAGSTTRGHAVLSPGTIAAPRFDLWRDGLRAAHVTVDAAQRRAHIVAEAERLAAACDCEARPSPSTLDEIVGLSENPTALRGVMDADFLSLPEAMIRDAMERRQRYIPLAERKTGRLSRHFVIIADHAGRDGGATIIRGHERVLRARLSDARFFWERDRRRSLASRLDDLEGMAFHARLGSMRAYAGRMAALSRRLATLLRPDDAAFHDRAERAALPAKADLTTESVREFPDLQGTIGARLIEAEGGDAETAAAIEGHYAPRGRDDAPPTAPLTVVTALADKLNLLCGLAAIGAMPTGSGDPYALRRAALGILRTAMENDLDLALTPFLAHGLELYRKDGVVIADADETCAALHRFLLERLRIELGASGAPLPLIAAVLRRDADCRPVDMARRVAALQAFARAAGEDPFSGCRRAAHLLAEEERRDARSYRDPVDEAALEDAAERRLYEAAVEAESRVGVMVRERNYDDLPALLTSLRGAVDAFFDAVIVNDPEPSRRVNRLRLLAATTAAIDRLADFSCIESLDSI